MNPLGRALPGEAAEPRWVAIRFESLFAFLPSFPFPIVRQIHIAAGPLRDCLDLGAMDIQSRSCHRSSRVRWLGHAGNLGGQQMEAVYND